jgi:hypothetical protein
MTPADPKWPSDDAAHMANMLDKVRVSGHSR